MKDHYIKKALWSLCLISSIGLSAQTFNLDGIAYEVNSATEHTVSVVKNSEGYTGSVVIPATVSHEGVAYTVTAIDYEAFYGCSKLKAVTLPVGLKQIGADAFRDCVGLSEIEIPKSVEMIGGHAFSCCENLQTITLTCLLYTSDAADD